MIFGSDNWAGVAPEIMNAIVAANEGLAPAYGGDELTRRAEARIGEIFECDCAVFFVTTGGAANGLALSVMTPPYGMILAHEASHIQMDECAGPEFFTGGAKILPIAGANGKLTPESIARTLACFPDRAPHGAPARVLSLTQATESGTLYSAPELQALCAEARRFGLKVHVDGARFANAVSALAASPADLTWRAGVDVLALGGTKNGCLAAEAVIFFNRKDAQDFAFRRKRAGHLLSKTRFIAAQFAAWFDEDLWLRLAAHANAMAKRLSQELARIDGVSIGYPTDINEVFASFPDGVAERLRNAGAAFYPWVTPGDQAAGKMQRLITSFRTQNADIEAFIAIVRRTINESSC